MRALRFTEFGKPDVLQVVDVDDPVATAADAVIRVHAASVNPSDVKNVAGAMDWTILPRTPGRDFAGVVVDGPAGWKGAAVWGTGGDVGFVRDGSHAEMMTVPVAALVAKPELLSFDDASTVGVNFVVAWYGLVETARQQPGEVVAVFGVSGGVGGAVAQIAHALGARVIGLDRRMPHADAPATAVIDTFIAMEPGSDPGAEIQTATGGRGADVVYDAVGGVTTAAALAALAKRGRLVVISAVGSPTVEINLLDLYHNETRILGTDSGKLSMIDSAQRLRQMATYFEAGAFKPLPIAQTYALQDAAQAYRAVTTHAPGRIVIQP